MLEPALERLSTGALCFRPIIAGRKDGVQEARRASRAGSLCNILCDSVNSARCKSAECFQARPMSVICPKGHTENRAIAKFCIECISTLPTPRADDGFAPTLRLRWPAATRSTGAEAPPMQVHAADSVA